MAPCSTAMRSEVKKPQVKCKGIHEPKGRVRGFRVEIRPHGSSKKIWVGTFDTRVKAKRAYDAAVYLTGKEPFYFVYPEGYFSSCPPVPSKEDVQILAKKFAEKTDDLAESVASRLGASSKAGQAKNVGSERTSPNATVVKKVAEKMNSPLQPGEAKILAELDQYLQEAEYLEVQPPLDWASLDCLSVQPKEVLEESKVDLEKSAYRRGLTSTQDIWKSLSDVHLPAPYEFPAIEDESVYLNFDTPLKVSSKRKRGVSQEIDPFNLDEDLGFSEGISADGDDWLSCVDGWLV